MKKLAMLLFVLALCVPVVNAASIDLKTAGSFGALAGTGVTNAVAGTIINGDVGSYPTPSISGLLPADVNGILYPAAGAVVGQAKLDLVDAYDEVVGAVDAYTPTHCQDRKRENLRWIHRLLLQQLGRREPEGRP